MADIDADIDKGVGTTTPKQDLDSTRSGWLKNYPPLITFLLAVMIAVLVLPSSLNLPNSNPSTVLEYAPVPPEDDTPSPPEGNISQLGLGSSSGLTTGQKDGPGAGSKPGGKGDKPITKKCVGKPARQAEDPNAPPCVPYFEGDNGGQTWQGVTAKEIVVIVYADRFITSGGSSGGETSPTANTYCDVDKPPDTENTCAARDGGSGLAVKQPRRDHFQVQIVRAYSKYFNERFQTYDRRVHFYIFWTNANSASTRRADASANWERYKPFAAIQIPAFGGYDDAYTEAVVKRSIMSFGALLPRANSYFRANAPYIWNFWPDVEHWADQYTSYICQKVAPYPVQHAGQGVENGGPRKFGFMYTIDPRFPALTYFANLVRAGIKSCPNGHSVTIAAEAPFSRHQYAIDNNSKALTEARTNVAEMQKAGVTSIIWAGGYETQHSLAAYDAKWFPEWIVAGDQWQDTIVNGRFQQQDVWNKHAWLMTNFLREDKQEEAPCRQAYLEADPHGDEEDSACDLYRSMFMLFKAIQVAGPYLQPETVDQGQHAIPRTKSPSPFVASCFYDPGDFTCVKDAREAWWDKDAPDPDGDPDEKGCWRMVRDGKRYLAGEWEGEDDVMDNPSDPCDNQGNSYDIHPYGDLPE